MKRTERAVRAELRTLGVNATTDGLAAVAVDLAQRLDGDVGDRVRAGYVRELRLALVELRSRTADESVDDVERFLASIANPALRGPGE